MVFGLTCILAMETSISSGCTVLAKLEIDEKSSSQRTACQFDLNLFTKLKVTEFTKCNFFKGYYQSIRDELGKVLWNETFEGLGTV